MVAGRAVLCKITRLGEVCVQNLDDNRSMETRTQREGNMKYEAKFQNGQRVNTEHGNGTIVTRGMGTRLGQFTYLIKLDAPAHGHYPTIQLHERLNKLEAI